MDSNKNDRKTTYREHFDTKKKNGALGQIQAQNTQQQFRQKQQPNDKPEEGVKEGDATENFFTNSKSNNIRGREMVAKKDQLVQKLGSLLGMIEQIEKKELVAATGLSPVQQSPSIKGQHVRIPTTSSGTSMSSNNGQQLLSPSANYQVVSPRTPLSANQRKQHLHQEGTLVPQLARTTRSLYNPNLFKGQLYQAQQREVQELQAQLEQAIIEEKEKEIQLSDLEIQDQQQKGILRQLEFEIAQEQRAFQEREKQFLQDKETLMLEIEFALGKIDERKQIFQIQQDVQTEIFEQYQRVQEEYKQIDEYYNSEEALEGRQQEYQRLVAENQRLQAAIAQLQAQKKDYNIEQVVAQQRELKSLLNKFLVEKEILQQQLEGLAEEVAYAERERHTLEEEGQREKIEEQQRLSETLEELTEKMKNNEATLSKLRQTKQNLMLTQEEGSEVQKEMEKLRIKKQILEANIVQIERKKEQALQKFRTDKDGANLRYLESVKLLEEKQRELQRLQDQLDNEGMLGQKREEDIGDLQNLLTRLSQKNTQLKKQKAELLEARTRVKSQLADFQLLGGSASSSNEVRQREDRAALLKMSANQLSVELNEKKRKKAALEQVVVQQNIQKENAERLKNDTRVYEQHAIQKRTEGLTEQLTLLNGEIVDLKEKMREQVAKKSFLKLFLLKKLQQQQIIVNEDTIANLKQELEILRLQQSQHEQAIRDAELQAEVAASGSDHIDSDEEQKQEDDSQDDRNEVLNKKEQAYQSQKILELLDQVQLKLNEDINKE